MKGPGGGQVIEVGPAPPADERLHTLYETIKGEKAYLEAILPLHGQEQHNALVSNIAVLENVLDEIRKLVLNPMPVTMWRVDMENMPKDGSEFIALHQVTAAGIDSEVKLERWRWGTTDTLKGTPFGSSGMPKEFDPKFWNSRGKWLAETSTAWIAWAPTDVSALAPELKTLEALYAQDHAIAVAG